MTFLPVNDAVPAAVHQLRQALLVGGLANAVAAYFSPTGPRPPLADTPGASSAATTPQVTASIHDFAGSLTWEALRTFLQDPAARAEIEALRLPSAVEVSLLRILDVAIWIRHSHSRAASRIRRDCGILEPGHSRP
jgi:hypothetical protein